MDHRHDPMPWYWHPDPAGLFSSAGVSLCQLFPDAALSPFLPSVPISLPGYLHFNRATLTRLLGLLDVQDVYLCKDSWLLFMGAEGGWAGMPGGVGRLGATVSHKPRMGIMGEKIKGDSYSLGQEYASQTKMKP